MKGIETSNDKQELNTQKEHWENRYIKVVNDISIYVLKGLSVVVGFTIALFAFAVFTSVAVAIGVVCGLVYAACEVAYNLKKLGGKVFGKQDNILDYYYDMQGLKDLKDLKDVMQSSKDVQDYLVRNISNISCDKNTRLTRGIDNKPKVVERTDNINTFDISR